MAMHTELSSPAIVRRLLAEHGLSANKSLGQNFLVDKNHLAKIVEAADLCKDDCVLEIGPGMGVLTAALAQRCKRVVALEIDRGLVRFLKAQFAGVENVRIIHEDALKADLRGLLDELRANDRRAKVVANLPYYITTPLIFRVLDARASVSSMVFLVQREVAQRLVASPGSPQYGALSVQIGYSCDVRIVATVPPSAFYPMPDVTSAVVRLDVLRNPKSEAPESVFSEVVRAAFGKRRKNLLNALSSIAPKAQIGSVLEDLGIDPRLRGETLSVEQFGRIAIGLANLRRLDVSARLDTDRQ